MPLSTLQSDMATGPGTQGVDLQGSEDVSQGVSPYFAALSAGAIAAQNCVAVTLVLVSVNSVPTSGIVPV